MGKINWFKTYLQEIQDNVAGINRNRMVIDNSQLTNYLDSHASTSNALLIGVLPDFNSKGTSGDDYKRSASTQLMVLNKTTYSEVNYDQFFQIFEDTDLLVELVLQKLLADSLSGCNNLRFLNVQSIQVVPVWNLSGCNGWNISFSFDLPL